MAEAQASIDIAAPADRVWAVVGDFGTLDWMPGVDSCELQGDDRTLGMYGSMTVVERQLARDDAARTLTYGIVGGDMTVESHEATITVTPQGEGSHVTWDVRTDESMLDVMRGAYEGALEALKAKLEA